MASCESADKPSLTKERRWASLQTYGLFKGKMTGSEVRVHLKASMFAVLTWAVPQFTPPHLHCCDCPAFSVTVDTLSVRVFAQTDAVPVWFLSWIKISCFRFNVFCFFQKWFWLCVVINEEEFDIRSFYSLFCIQNISSKPYRLQCEPRYWRNMHVAIKHSHDKYTELDDVTHSIDII